MYLYASGMATISNRAGNPSRKMEEELSADTETTFQLQLQNTYSGHPLAIYYILDPVSLKHRHTLTHTHTSHTSSLKAIRPKLKLLSRKLEVLRGLNYILIIKKRLTSS